MRLILSALLAAVLTTIGSASLGAEYVSNGTDSVPNGPKRLPRLNERGRPTVLYLRTTESGAKKWFGLWLVDQHRVPSSFGPPPPPVDRTLTNFRFALWEIRPASEENHDPTVDIVSGQDLTLKQRYPIEGVDVTDICTVTIDGTGKSFAGQEYMKQGKSPLAFYCVSGHLVDPTYNPKTLLPGFYEHLLCAEIDDACANADRVIFVRQSDQFAASAEGAKGPYVVSDVQRSDKYYSRNGIQELLRRDTKKDLLVVEFNIFEQKEQQVLKDLQPLFSALGYERTLVISPLPTGWTVLQDLCRTPASQIPNKKQE